ncbi:type III-B CRISPR module-associated protein Cmr5 [Lysobacteraceae bacterium NML71-0210]|nr:type III-B CRISPR module-associated protein Cmr5 [Xanthomonadaceae bacterium NML71-0210]
MTTQNLPTMDQERARFALARIEAISKKDAVIQAEVRRYINGLPALIHMNGLGQAMAFYRSKSKGDDKKETSHKLIYDILGLWLCGKDSKGRIFSSSSDLLAAITQSDMQHYMAAQNEAQAVLEWLKKFAVALLATEEAKHE